MSPITMRMIAGTLFLAMMFGYSRLLQYVSGTFGLTGVLVTGIVVTLSMLLLLKLMGGDAA